MSELYAIRTVGDDSLQHYGVLSMRWGVHRNPSRAYAKATKKLTKLNNRVKKAETAYNRANLKTNSGASQKYRKLQAKADKLQYKSDRKRMGLFPNAQKAYKYQMMADRAQYKADRYKSRHEENVANKASAEAELIRAKNKADRWQKSMDKAFRNVDVKSLVSSQSTAAGKEFIKKVA